MEKRNKLALLSLMKELEALTDRRQLDCLGDDFIEPHQIKSSLEILKNTMSEHKFRELKEKFRDAGLARKKQIEGENMSISEQNILEKSNSLENSKFQKDDSSKILKNRENSLEANTDNVIDPEIYKIDIPKTVKNSKKNKLKYKKIEDEFESVGIKEFLGIIEEIMKNLVSEEETLLAFRTLTKFKEESISVTEMRYLLSTHGEISSSEVDELILLASGVKKLNQIEKDQRIDFKDFVEKIFAISS